MSESQKTLVYLAAAVVAVAASFFTRPESAVYNVDDQIGKMLTPPFESEQAKRMTVVKFKEDTAELSQFDVTEQDGVWTIPSKGGYPADAFDQMAEATTGVVDREILRIASESAADHEQYGVVDPRSPRLEVGQTGVGVRVTLADENDDPLADLIIGKGVLDQPSQRYVRRQSQDVVYVVEIDPEKFSTSFEDWIEDDLLQINTRDMHGVAINDYSFELVIEGRNAFPDWRRRGKYSLRYDGDKSEWSADEMLTFDEEQSDYRPAPLAESETLRDDVLRDLQSALDDLRIVDVEPKPEGLSGSLRVDEDFVEKLDQAGLNSLYSRGFVPVPITADRIELLSSEGEITCTMKDGVEYVLRFGDIQSQSNSEGAEGAGSNRFLFVVARFNESVIEKPELEKLPAEEAADAGEGDAEEQTAKEQTDEELINAEQTDAEDATDANPAEADGDEQPDQAGDSERDAIERRNREKTAAYEAKLEQGRKRVDDLNDRFGDWYYVVADDVYSKIRLGRDALVESEEQPAEAGGDEAGGDDSVLGAPGTAVPGLPDLGAFATPPAERGAEPSAEESATADSVAPDSVAPDSAAPEGGDTIDSGAVAEPSGADEEPNGQSNGEPSAE